MRSIASNVHDWRKIVMAVRRSLTSEVRGQIYFIKRRVFGIIDQGLRSSAAGLVFHPRAEGRNTSPAFNTVQSSNMGLRNDTRHNGGCI